MYKHVDIIERVMMLAAGLLLIVPGLVTDTVGGLLFITSAFYNYSKKRSETMSLAKADSKDGYSFSNES